MILAQRQSTQNKLDISSKSQQVCERLSANVTSQALIQVFFILLTKRSPGMFPEHVPSGTFHWEHGDIPTDHLRMHRGTLGVFPVECSCVPRKKNFFKFCTGKICYLYCFRNCPNISSTLFTSVLGGTCSFYAILTTLDIMYGYIDMYIKIYIILADIFQRCLWLLSKYKPLKKSSAIQVWGVIYLLLLHHHTWMWYH